MQTVQRKWNKGFTLVELLVVVVIIGILASFAVMEYKRAIARSRAAQLETMLQSVVDATEVYFMTNGTYPVSLDDLDTTTGLESAGKTTTCGSSLVPSSVKKGKDFEIALFTVGVQKRYSLSAHFTTGKYKCTGFVYYLDVPIKPDLNHKMFCAEHYYNRSCGTYCERGAFCNEVMGKTYQGYFDLISRYK